MEDSASKAAFERKVRFHLTIDIPQWQDGETNYTAHVFALINKADPGNRHKLKTLFPTEVEAWCRWNQHRWEACEPPPL